eukprot:CAMPEP_0195059658 /NCGR_PEP_ID=MMETSP0448-20130528/7102_1 /TAXON_ID=66468 /ORGANISM="Heterocapsa triquestra, Strain CCMP 448" /LENGTH=139 /DNA_ID=CAMNT_0040089973 /DNA_START=206 /DNA_END=621 /DNA_ORIENTATION=+
MKCNGLQQVRVHHDELQHAQRENAPDQDELATDQGDAKLMRATCGGFVPMAIAADRQQQRHHAEDHQDDREPRGNLLLQLPRRLRPAAGRATQGHLTCACASITLRMELQALPPEPPVLGAQHSFIPAELCVLAAELRG